MAGQKMPLEQALAVMKAGQVCHADYYGRGWSTGWHEGTQSFYDINPRTGSTMLHPFEPATDKDAAAKWRIGCQPKEPKS